MFDQLEIMEIMRLIGNDEKNKIILGKTIDQITTKDSSYAF